MLNPQLPTPIEVQKSIVKTAAVHLRTIADQLEKVKEPVEIAHAISELDSVNAKLFRFGADWCHAQAKAS